MSVPSGDWALRESLNRYRKAVGLPEIGKAWYTFRERLTMADSCPPGYETLSGLDCYAFDRWSSPDGKPNQWFLGITYIPVRDFWGTNCRTPLGGSLHD